MPPREGVFHRESRPTAPPTSTIWMQAMVAAAMLYCGILLTWTLVQPMPALQDLGEWMFQGWAMAKLIEGDRLLRSMYIVRFVPVPNLASQWLLTAFTFVTGPYVAAKLVVSLYVAAAVGVCWKAARRFAGENWTGLFVVLLTTVAFNACFWHGYMNFQFGLVALVWYMQASKGEAAEIRTIFWMSLLLYACHAAAWASFVLLVGLQELRRGRRWTAAAALVPTVVLFLVYLIARRPPAQDGHGERIGHMFSFLAYKAYTLAKAGPFHNLVDTHGHGANLHMALYACGVAINALFVAGLFAAVYAGLRKGRWRAEAGLLLPFWGVLLVLFLAMPPDLAEVVNLGERFLYILLASLLMWCGFSRLEEGLAVVCLAGCFLTAYQLPRSMIHNMQDPQAVAHEPESNGRAYAADGLFSHRLFQNDLRRTELRDHKTHFAPLLFDTWMLAERDPSRTRTAASLMPLSDGEPGESAGGAQR